MSGKTPARMAAALCPTWRAPCALRCEASGKSGPGFKHSDKGFVSMRPLISNIALRARSDRLEGTRERLEDTSRCFHLLDRALGWALATAKTLSRTAQAHGPPGASAAASSACTVADWKQLQHHLMAHPPPEQAQLAEMLQLARKLRNDRLLEQCKVSGNAGSAHHAGACLRTHAARLVGRGLPEPDARCQCLSAVGEHLTRFKSVSVEESLRQFFIRPMGIEP